MPTKKEETDEEINETENWTENDYEWDGLRNSCINNRMLNECVDFLRYNLTNNSASTPYPIES